MIFTTKAEYGVRLMVELGRQAGDAPGLAEGRSPRPRACRSPTSSTSSRCCRRRPRREHPRRPRRLPPGAARRARSRWTRWSRRSRARSRRWSASIDDAEGRVLCSHETDGDHACATKLLWTRVQGGVTKALAGTTLAELVEFADAATRPRRSPPAAPPCSAA